MSICEDISIPGDDPASAMGFVVGRRPVIDSKLEVFGYRLAVGAERNVEPSDGPVTADLAERGRLRSLFGRKPAFLRPTQAFLTGAQELPFDREQTVIDLDVRSTQDPRVLDACRRRVRDGHRLAVHCPETFDASDEVLDLADFIRLDVGEVATSPFCRDDGLWEGLDGRVERATSRGAHAVAVGVDTFGQLTAAKLAGFSLFEGRVLSRPAPAIAETITPSRLACLQMLQKVSDPDTSAHDLARIVETDPGLSHRLLHISGLGADGGLRRPVRSIREAAVLLGRESIHKWLVLMVVADANGGTPEQMTIAMTRGRMCELMAGAVAPAERASAFTVGVVSAMDILMGVPIAEVVAKLAITDDLKWALTGRQGRLGEILSDVLDWMDWELGSPISTLRSGVGPRAAEGYYLDAVEWATLLTDSLPVAA